jgi:hypothetical protein
MGPTALEMPTVALNRPNARARSRPVNSCWISAEFCGARKPAAMPWARRAAMTSPTLGAAPTAALHSTKADSEIRKIRRRPTASPSRPATTRARAKVSAYPETTHCTVAGPVCRSRCIEGSATDTIVTSKRIMKPATRVTHNACQRLGSGPGSCWASGSAPVGDRELTTTPFAVDWQYACGAPCLTSHE